MSEPIHDVLRRAAELVESSGAITAANAIYLALALNSEGDYQAGQPLNIGLYEQACTALAAHLGYATGHTPAAFLRRWSQQHTPAETANRIRAALAWTPNRGDAVVWGGQTGAWIVQGFEDDETAWIHRPGVRMIPMVARPGSGLVDLAPYRLEPEHAELVAVAELRPAVEAKGGVR